jgi:hypothetical protein
MGERGPIPKREEERVRRNKTGEDGRETETVTMVGKVEVPKVEFVTPVVQQLWASLPLSGQAKYYEPSDWSYAVLTLNILDNVLADGKVPSAMMLASVDGMMKSLLLTEGERRRMRLEVQRVEAEAQLIDAQGLFRERWEQMRIAREDVG